MVVLGLVFAFFGLGMLPVDRQVFQPWFNSVYGATFMGWGAAVSRSSGAIRS